MNFKLLSFIFLILKLNCVIKHYHYHFENQHKMKLYVGSLSYDVSQDDLVTKFGEFGKVTKANVITDRYTGRSRGFAFVEMENESEAVAAMNKLDNSDFMGRTIRVNKAK